MALTAEEMAALQNLLGQDVTPKIVSQFQSANPLTMGGIHGAYFTPYITRVDTGEAQPFYQTPDQRTLKNYIQEVNKYLQDYATP
jgi:hypothetical protein